MPKKIELAGQTFGRLTVVGRMPFPQQGHVYWECRCSCGKTRFIAHSNLRSGESRSCGKDCVHREPRNVKVDPGTRKSPVKLDESKVRLIRRLWADRKKNGITQAVLAKTLGVSKLSILRIVNRQTYRDVIA